MKGLLVIMTGLGGERGEINGYSKRKNAVMVRNKR